MRYGESSSVKPKTLSRQAGIDPARSTLDCMAKAKRFDWILEKIQQATFSLKFDMLLRSNKESATPVLL